MRSVSRCLGIVMGLVALLLAGGASARLLYQETVTIILDDGTQVVLVLDDYGMTTPAPPASRQMQQAKFDYLKRVAQARKDFDTRNPMRPPIVMAVGKAASSTQDKSNQALQPAKGGLTEALDARRNHLRGQYLWPLKSGPEKHYYYLPPPPRVARDATGRPQFLFMKFTSDKDKAHGGVAGGILHFLTEYGLSTQQETELKQKVAAVIPGAKVMGAVPMEMGEGESTFRVISATLSDTGLTQRVVSSGKAPLMPGQKVAAAARLDPAGAVLLEESLKRPTSDISVEFDLAFTSFLPAFDGTITFDWERFKSHIDDWKMKYRDRKDCKWWIFGCHHHYTTDEIREIYDMMCENETIRIEWTEGIADERLEAIRQAFFKFMETSFFERTAAGFGEEGGEEDKKLTEGMTTPEQRGSTTDFNRYVAKSEDSYKNKTITMRVTLPVKQPYVTVGNISGQWYRKAKGDYPELFAEVNVDDPFFQQRKVVFNLDLDAVEIFDQAINFVTVEVRKQRPGGRDFHDSFTINKQWIGASGPTATVTYAKMRDDSPEVFDYLVRWSLRGGIEWPGQPSWIKGNWEGVTLAPPVIPLKIEAEADLEELKGLDIARAVVEVRYTQFGKTVTDTRALQVSVAKGEPVASLLIFRDRDKGDWDYRVTFYHKRLGPKQGSWARGGEGGYVFCTVPEALRATATAAKAAGSE